MGNALCDYTTAYKAVKVIGRFMVMVHSNAKWTVLVTMQSQPITALSKLLKKGLSPQGTFCPIIRAIVSMQKATA